MKLPRKAQVASVLVLVGASVFAKVSGGAGHAGGGAQPRKLALLVGVDKYRDPKIPTLSGCKNDVANWEDVLIKKYGFAAGDILKLTDEQATKAAVKDAFAKHLVAQATAETVVFVAFSSHGTQVLDKDGDEITDGLDESVVLHDSNFSDDPVEANVLIDDEINLLITDLNKKTKHVVLISDSCFSGTLARAAGQVRFLPISDKVRAQAAELVAKNRTFVEGERDSIKPTQGKGPNYALISAAQSNETANERFFEGKTNGALTWYLTAALRKADADATYKDVFDKARFDVATAFPSQHPDLDGAEQDTAIFGLRPVPKEPYLAVETAPGNLLTLGGGQVHGISVGSRFGIFPPGTKTTKGATAIATAVVKSVALTTSQAELASPGVAIPGGARAFPTEWMVPIHRAKVFVPATPAVMAKISEGLRNNPAVELLDHDKGYDLRVAHDASRRALVLEGGSQEPMTDPIPENQSGVATTMVQKIAGWAKWLNVRNLDNPGNGPAVSFKMHRLGKDTKTTTSDNNLTRLVDGEKFELQIENRDDRALYFNVLDLSSTGEIKVSSDVGEVAVVKPHETWRSSFEATLNKGFDYDRDTAKLVVSTKPLDLRFVEQSSVRGGSARGDGSVSSILGDLVGQAAFGSTTRSFKQNKDVADQWTTKDLVFEVQPKVTAEEQSLVKSCYDDLRTLGVPWKKGPDRRGVVDPVLLEPSLHGVTFRNSLGRIAPLYMSCLFAEKVAKFTKMAAALGVTEIQHLGIYNYRCIGGGTPDGRACKVSQHAYGRAIDFASFKTSNGTFVVKNDWTKRSNPPPTCNATGGSQQDQFLRKLACEAGRAEFNILLTPNYNAAHRDHFHADATPNAKSVRGGGSAASGADPDDLDLGD